MSEKIDQVIYLFEDIYNKQTQNGYIPMYHYIIPRKDDEVFISSNFFDNYNNISNELKELIKKGNNFVVKKVRHEFLSVFSDSLLIKGTDSWTIVYLKQIKVN